MNDEDEEFDDDLDDGSRYGFDVSSPQDSKSQSFDDHYDADRYDSAAGWRPHDKYKKQRDDYRKKHPLEFFNGSIFSREGMGEVFSADVNTKPAQNLFGDLVRNGELTILFADTGVGKSVLAVQIGDAVARGVSALSVPRAVATDLSVPGAVATGAVTPNSQLLPNEAKPLPVLYIDFEMTKAQVAERYSTGVKKGKWAGQYRFPKLMQRTYLDWQDELPEGFKTFTEFINFSLWGEVADTGCRLLIVDNISYLLSSASSSKEAGKLMKTLKALKDQFGLAILVLAHTPKRSLAKFLSLNDLAGQKTLSNFIDNSFAIGRSHLGSDMRYIKQIKQRNRPELYGEDNVIVCRLKKRRNFPRFEFVEFGHERPHLLRPFEDPGFNREKLIEQARELAAQNWTQRAIATHLGVGLTTVNRYLSEPPA